MEENKNLEKSNDKIKNIKSSNQKGKIVNILNSVVKVILYLIYVILIIIAIVLIYNIIQVSILNKSYMNIFGYSFFQVKTGSMSGTIETGDIIIVKLTKDVSKDDIITYEKDQTLITHRIIENQGEKIITKGDANNIEDEPITRNQVIGKVVYIFKNIEIWKQVFTTPEVYILVIITLVLFGITISIKEKINY